MEEENEGQNPEEDVAQSYEFDAPEVSFCKVVLPPPFHAIAPKSSKAKESPLPFADFELSKAVSRFAQWENALAVVSTKFFSKMDNFTNHMNSLMATIIHLQSQVQKIKDRLPLA
ncbi:hypothetical protein M9H77_35272 [Catharanthus roseus]|uniref:Uncharacterized protein n=1 Tax=Catharanthus roseus TaxID=4058 RepID=A0ACB9ZNJ0_CATRO|nr:hypothetical protein M9H77_35272 [Catharanthus roseus]